jgi:hypothetical protein
VFASRGLGDVVTRSFLWGILIEFHQRVFIEIVNLIMIVIANSSKITIRYIILIIMSCASLLFCNSPKPNAVPIIDSVCLDLLRHANLAD